MSGHGGGAGGQMSADEALARQLQDKFFLQELQVFYLCILLFLRTQVCRQTLKKKFF
jgi:hypothetical protein